MVDALIINTGNGKHMLCFSTLVFLYRYLYSTLVFVSKAFLFLFVQNVLGRSSSTVYAIALLASGQSSTITGTYAGQFIMQVNYFSYHEFVIINVIQESNIFHSTTMFCTQNVFYMTYLYNNTTYLICDNLNRGSWTLR